MLYKVLQCIFFVILEPDVVVKRQEALAAARLKMQEELNAQVEKHKEKLRQVRTGFSLRGKTLLKEGPSFMVLLFRGSLTAVFRPTKLCAQVPRHQTRTGHIQLLAPLSV